MPLNEGCLRQEVGVFIRAHKELPDQILVSIVVWVKPPSTEIWAP